MSERATKCATIFNSVCGMWMEQRVFSQTYISTYIQWFTTDMSQLSLSQSWKRIFKLTHQNSRVLNSIERKAIKRPHLTSLLPKKGKNSTNYRPKQKYANTSSGTFGKRPERTKIQFFINQKIFHCHLWRMNVELIFDYKMLNPTISVIRGFDSKDQIRLAVLSIL